MHRKSSVIYLCIHKYTYLYIYNTYLCIVFILLVKGIDVAQNI